MDSMNAHIHGCCLPEREFELPVRLSEYAVTTVMGEGSMKPAAEKRLRCTLPPRRSYLWLRLSR